MLQICNKPKYRELTLFSGLIELHVALNRFKKKCIYIYSGGYLPRRKWYKCLQKWPIVGLTNLKISLLHVSFTS